MESIDLQIRLKRQEKNLVMRLKGLSLWVILSRLKNENSHYLDLFKQEVMDLKLTNKLKIS